MVQGPDREAVSPRVFTIPPGAPFLPTFAQALLGGSFIPGFEPARDPLALATATIFVPTRRAARALAAALAEAADAPALLLPRILPLGALEAIETELIFDEPALGTPLSDELPDAIAPMARRMILTRLILQWAQAVRRAVVAVEPDGTRELHPSEELLVATSAADAWRLSGDLAALSDELTAEGIDWARVPPLGTEAHDRYWRITLDFLSVVVEHWPALLKERGVVDAAQRQIALIEAEIARLGRGGGEGPVIVAGSTGSHPATARLIAAIARLPGGAVVLPGLDQDLDEPGWTAIGAADADGGATHPQGTLKRLLGTMGVTREGVRPLGVVAAPVAARAGFVSQALRPAGTTERWVTYAAEGNALGPSLAGLTLLEAPDERTEALGIAILMREALEGAGTAVLVTPDRALGRRVREELTRWGIEIDESSGEPLGTTPAGALARLALDSAVQDLAPVEVLALLAHPLVRLGRNRTAVTALARTLEIAILRGVLPPRALHDPQALLDFARRNAGKAHAPDPLRRLLPGDFEALATFLDDLGAALAPLVDLGREASLPDWHKAHQATIDALTAMPDGDTALTGTDGNALLDLFERLGEAEEPEIRLDPLGYAALFDRFAAETPVRGPDRSHPRLKILGLLEARLLSADLVIAGGLDEGVWPPQSRTDAFLNRPMRASLGLPPPERRIGQTAHDLSMLLGHSHVVLTRAAKREGSPTVPSRFLLRMAALAGPDAWAAVRARGTATLALAEALDQPGRVAPVRRPAPRPPVELRPQQLSVTRIETLRRDPYAIYAETILKLRPAEPIGAVMGPSHQGTIFHDLMAGFSKAYADGQLPLDAAEALRRDTKAAFGDALVDPVFQAFGWPKVVGWAEAFLRWEAERRARGGRPPLIEGRGTLRLPLLDGSVFTLTAVADRIEIGPDGLVTVVDYKTGRAPTAREVKAGFAPQLTLEAAMAERGAFPALGEGAAVEGAFYVKFEPRGEAVPAHLTWKDHAFSDVVAEHFEGLVTLLNLFRDPKTGYLARPFPQFARAYNPYDHLARVKEWSAGGVDGEGEGA